MKVLGFLWYVYNINWVVATQILFIFTPNPAEMIQFDEHMFQIGWFNHQPEQHSFVELMTHIYFGRKTPSRNHVFLGSKRVLKIAGSTSQ